MKQTLLIGLALGLLTSPTMAAEKKLAGETYEVPYRLTLPKHVLVRAKINGKGPFNFILDTGAPALFVATKVAKALGVDPEKGWGTFDTFEVEGGVVFKKAKGRIEDPFQLEGMNGMGLAGAELHGVIGYNLLAQYRMTFDFTKNKMVWTKIDWVPKAPMGLGGGQRGGQGGMEIFGTIMKMVGSFLGRKANPDLVPQGFLGIEVREEEGLVYVKKVMEGSPAAEAGLKEGDLIRRFGRRSVYGIDGLQSFMKKAQAGKKIKLRVVRGADKETVELNVTVGEGL